MKGKWILMGGLLQRQLGLKAGVLLGGLLTLALLLLVVGLTQAQETETPTEGVQPQEETGVTGNVNRFIPIQGRLTDPGGKPYSGTYTINLYLYDAQSGGNLICSDTAANNVPVNNGLFQWNFQGDCGSDDLNGRQLYMALQVGGETLSPRQPIYPVPYAFGLKPGAIISSTATSGHSLEVWSNAGDGASGTALWVRNTNSANGIALWAHASGTDATIVAGNSGTGPLIKGFGGDGGEHEFIVNNDGSIWTEGKIQSATNSYVFVPGTAIVKNVSDDSTRWDMQISGSVKIYRGSTTGNKTIYVPIILPAVLYGQPVRLTEMRVYYRCQDGTKNFINSTYLAKQTSVGTSVYLIQNTTDYTSSVASSYTLSTNSTYNTLSAEQGILAVHFGLTFVDDTNSIELGGIRLTLEHD